MATRKPDPVKYSSPDGGQTKYLENQRVADDLKKKGVKATAGKASGDRSKRMAKNKEYVARKRSSSPTKRTVAGNTTQPVSRPANVQGPVMRNGSYGNSPTPPAQTFAQNGMNMPSRPMGQYGPVQGPAMQNGQFGMGQQAPMQGPPPQMQQPMMQQPMMQQRPSAFGQPNSAMTMGIQPMGNPYMNSQNPAQVMQGYQPPMGNQNPWGRRW
jgi:hypothetical protein